MWMGQAHHMGSMKGGSAFAQGPFALDPCVLEFVSL